MAELGGKADLVLSDMAPNTTGHAATDHLRIVALAEAALAFALEVLAEGGGFVAKVFQGGAERTMLEALKRHFRRCGMRSRRLAGRSLPNCMWWLRGFGVGVGLCAVGFLTIASCAAVARAVRPTAGGMEPQSTQSTQTDGTTRLV